MTVWPAAVSVETTASPIYQRVTVPTLEAHAESWEAIVPAAALQCLAKIARRDGAELVLMREDDRLIFRPTRTANGRSLYLSVLEGWPDAPETGDDPETWRIDGTDLLAGILAVRRASCGEEGMHPNLEGVHVTLADGALSVEATNGHRIHRYERRPSPSCDAAPQAPLALLIPPRAAGALMRLIQHGRSGVVEIRLGPLDGARRVVRFDCEGSSLVTRIGDAMFPATAQVWPAPGSIVRSVTVDARPLLDAARLAIAASASWPILGLDLDGCALRVSAISGTPDGLKAIYSETVPVPAVTDGPSFSMVLDARYLRAAVRSVGCDAVTLGFIENLSPLLVTSAVDAGAWSSRAVVMPRRRPA